MKLSHRLPVGQTVVFETYNRYKIGKIIEARPTVKRIEYTVYGEDGKVYENMPNKFDGTYRIDVELTKKYCKKNNIEVDEYAAEYAAKIKSTKVIADSDSTDLSVFDSQMGDKYEKTESESED